MRISDRNLRAHVGGPTTGRAFASALMLAEEAVLTGAFDIDIDGTTILDREALCSWLRETALRARHLGELEGM